MNQRTTGLVVGLVSFVILTVALTATTIYFFVGMQKEAEKAKNASDAQRLAQEKDRKTKKALLTKDRKRELMRDIAESTTQKTQDRLRAMELDAKLAGDFAPDRVEVETGPNTLEAVRERAAKMASALTLLME
jgi:hypothetical protein